MQESDVARNAQLVSGPSPTRAVDGEHSMRSPSNLVADLGQLQGQFFAVGERQLQRLGLSTQPRTGGPTSTVDCGVQRAWNQVAPTRGSTSPAGRYELLPATRAPASCRARALARLRLRGRRSWPDGGPRRCVVPGMPGSHPPSAGDRAYAARY